MKSELNVCKTKCLDFKFKEEENKIKTLNGNFEAALENLIACNEKSTSNLTENKNILICKMENSKCQSTDLIVKYPNSTIESVNDKNGAEVEADKVNSLEIIQQQTLFLPTNLSPLLPEFKTLTVTDSGLFWVDSTSFQGMEKLTELNLNKNKIMKITVDAFKVLKNLLTLNLSNNKIKKIEDGTFKNLGKLQELLLNQNFLESISNRIFEPLENLEKLQMENNKLLFISSNFLSQLSKLKFLDLSENSCIDLSFPNNTKKQITDEIEEKCVPPIELECFFNNDKTYLEEMITISGYKCKVVKLTIESKSKKITKVSGNHVHGHGNGNVSVFQAIEQNLNYFPSNLGEIFPNLEEIVIEKSNLKSIEKQNFESFTNLKTISLRNNNLTSIDDGTFDDSIKLEYLNLAHNFIEKIPKKAFATLVQLKILDLSHNQLRTLSGSLIPKKNSIAEFRANKNKLSIIDLNIFRSLKMANLIDCTENDCIDMKYDKTDYDGKTLNELINEAFMECG